MAEKVKRDALVITPKVDWIEPFMFTIDGWINMCKKNTIVITNGSSGIVPQVIVNVRGVWEDIGLIGWLTKNCPDKRVVHLMNCSKKHRTRVKNIKRAMRILSEFVDVERKEV